jgi:non-specific serine/threonine protein kinase
MTLRIHLLGPMRAFDGPSAIKLPPRARHLSLWAFLLVHRRKATPRDLLAYTFWPDESEAQARLNLRRNIHRLSQMLPSPDPMHPWLLSDRRSLQWNPSSDAWLDVESFESLSAEPARLAEALELYSADLLEGLYDEWVFAERERLRDLYVQDLLEMIDRCESTGDHRRAIDFTQRLLRHDPLREETYRSLMRLHARGGDRAGLVQTYNACATVLQRELGVEPSPETVQAYRELLEHRTPAAGELSPATRPRPSARHNLPVLLTSFVGRERELEDVRTLLKANRLLTLTGIGGVGKTRLALALADSVVDLFRDGVWWVDLAPLADPSLMGQAMASAIGLRDQSTRPIVRALADAIRPKAMLVVLDTCEHLVASCAEIVSAMLSEAPGVRFLATSTEPLGVPGEVTWRVPPLSLPPAVDDAAQAVAEEALRHSASGRLFLERAAAALPTFRLTASNLAAVVRLCQALDGIPLALELAAARLKMLSVEQLVERLDDRFRLLAGGGRFALPRHRTLRAVLDWSHGLLSGGEQALFRRLSLFVGGFTLESAEIVCDGDPLSREEILEVLSELVDKSLVLVSRADPTRVRYGMLETVGHYAREKLIESDEADRVRREYTRQYVDLIDQAGDRLLRGPDQEHWFWIIDQEYDNLRSLLSFAEAAGDAETLARITGRLWPFWWTHGYVAEGRRWLESAISRRADLTLRLQAGVLHAAGRLMILQGDFAQAALVLEENLTVVRRLEDRPAEADALSSLGMVFSHLQDYDHAQGIWREALATYQAQGDRWGVARALNNLGDLLIYRVDFAGAVERLEQAVALFRDLNSTLGESIGLINLGRAALQLKQAEKAGDLFRQSLRLKQALADKEGIAWNLEGLAGVAGEQGSPERAARLFGAADALRRSIGIPIAPADLPLHERSLTLPRSQVDPQTWHARWSEGAAMDPEQSIAYALAPSE